VASVRAVDISLAMTEALAERAADAGLANVSIEVTDLKDFRLPPALPTSLSAATRCTTWPMPTSGRWPRVRRSGWVPAAAWSSLT
jgi:hypothetical protein